MLITHSHRTMNLLHLHRSPDATDLANVSVDPANGVALINMSAPSVLPAAEEPAAPAPAPTQEVSTANMRIEDVVAAMQAQAPTDTAPSGDENPDAGADAPTTGAETDPAGYVVELPPREAGGEPLQLQVSTQEEADALRRLNNGYARREEVRAMQEQLAQREAAIEAVTLRFTEDPTGFLVDNLPADRQLAVAKVLVARLAEEHGQELDALLGDSVARREALLESKEQREQWRQKAAEERAVVEYRNQVLSSIEALIPEGASDEDAEEFVRDSGAYLAAIARAGGTVEPDAVSSLLAAKVKRYGFDRAPAPRPANGSGSRDAAKVPATPPPPAAPTKAATPLTPALLRARAAATAVTPQGSGAVPATIARPPKGMRIEDAATWFRNQSQAAS